MNVVGIKTETAVKSSLQGIDGMHFLYMYMYRVCSVYRVTCNNDIIVIHDLNTDTCIPILSFFTKALSSSI